MEELLNKLAEQYEVKGSKRISIFTNHWQYRDTLYSLDIALEAIREKGSQPDTLVMSPRQWESFKRLFEK